MSSYLPRQDGRSRGARYCVVKARPMLDTTTLHTYITCHCWSLIDSKDGVDDECARAFRRRSRRGHGVFHPGTQSETPSDSKDPGARRRQGRKRTQACGRAVGLPPISLLTGCPRRAGVSSIRMRSGAATRGTLSLWRIARC